MYLLSHYCKNIGFAKFRVIPNSLYKTAIKLHQLTIIDKAPQELLADFLAPSKSTVKTLSKTLFEQTWAHHTKSAEGQGEDRIEKLSD